MTSASDVGGKRAPGIARLHILRRQVSVLGSSSADGAAGGGVEALPVLPGVESEATGQGAGGAQDLVAGEAGQRIHDDQRRGGDARVDKRDRRPHLGVTIDVVIPMLGRPESVEPLLASLKPEDGIEFVPIFVVSPDDHDVRYAVEQSGENHIVMARPPEGGDFARKTNTAFRATAGAWVFLGASDLRFHEGWARTAIKVGEEYNAGVVGTDDMGNPAVKAGKHSTHALVRRGYIETTGGGWDGPGVVYHEGYFHQYVDTELVVAAQARGRWVFAHGSKVEHLHPFWHKGEMDDTYRRALHSAMGRRDAKLFRSRSREHVHSQVQGGRVRRSHPVRANRVGGQDAA